MNTVSAGFVLTACMLSSLTSWSMAPRPPETMPLWEPLPAATEPGDTIAKHEPWIIREQAIRFTPTVLSALRDPAGSLPVIYTVTLSDEFVREVEITGRHGGAASATIVQGRLAGTPQGDIRLAIKDEAVAGTIRLGKRTWSIGYRGEGRHRLIELDPEKMPPD